MPNPLFSVIAQLFIYASLVVVVAGAIGYFFEFIEAVKNLFSKKS